MAIQDLIQSAKRTMAVAQTEIEFLSSLPAQLNVTGFWQLRGSWNIVVSGISLAEALALMAPVPLAVHGRGESSRPYEVTPATDSRFVLKDGTSLVAPVYMSAADKCTWYSRVLDAQGSPQLLRITLEQVGEPPMFAGYSLVPTCSGGFVFLRKQVPPVLTESGPMDLFHKAWDELLATLNLRANQLRFAVAMKHWACRGDLVQATTLPDWVARIGPFQDLFTDEQAKTLIDGCNRIVAQFGPQGSAQSAEAAYIPEVLRKAEQAVTALYFLAALQGKKETVVNPEVLQYYLQQKMGLGISVHYRHSRVGPLKGQITHELWLHYRKWNHGVSLVLSDSGTPDSVAWLNPGYVAIQYEPLEVLETA